MSQRLFILDAPGYVYRAYHALPYLSTSKGLPSHVMLGTSTMVWKLLREESPEYFVAAWDPPGPTFREERFTAYKETRPAMPDDLRVQLPYVRRLFEALRVPLLEVPGFEADDVLGTLVDRVKDEEMDVVLVTADKDMLQLVGPRVRVLTTAGRGGERVVLDEAAVKEKWGVSPEQIPDLLALMGDSIDNIPGVPGVGEKTAVKLIGQFGSVERLYENLHLVQGKLRETLATHRAKALLSRELAVVSTRVPLPGDLESLRRQEPDWDKLRALWTELEFGSLLRQLPAAPAVAIAAEAAPVLADAAALGAYLSKLPAGDPIAVEWAGESGPPDPTPTALGLFHPAAGPATLVYARSGEAETHERAPLPDLGGRRVIGHDAKHLVQWWLDRGGGLPAIEDTAIVAYLLNPARTNYRLEEVAAELLGEGPGLAPPGSRARWIWELWAMAPRALTEVGLSSLYEDVERPLVPVLADMERAGIRVDPERLGEFSRELELTLDRVTREIYVLAGGEFNIGSPKQLATILFEKLKLPPVRKTKTGYSTDADVLEQLALGHELPAKIIEHRTIAKLKSTYADALPTLINPRTGRIHTSFNQLVAVTGRLSSSQPNLQNIPIRTELGRRIRAAFVPEPGRQLPRRRLLADRAAHPRPRLGRREPDRGVPPRRGHPPAHRRRGLRYRAGARDVPAARRGEDDQLRGHLRRDGLRPVPRARHDDEAGAAVSRPVLRPPSQGEGVSGAHGGRGSPARLRVDAARPPALSPGAPERQPQPARLRRAHGDQRADPGHRGRSHQDRDGARRPRAVRARPPEPDAVAGPR